MKKKFDILALCSFGLALVIFGISYIFYHYTLPGGSFTTVWQPTPGKPLVTELVAIFGVLFLFAGVMSLLVGHIFFREEENQ